MRFLLYLPAWLSVIIAGVVPAAVSLLWLKFVGHKFSSEMLKENHEATAFVFNAFGFIYALLATFVVYVS